MAIAAYAGDPNPNDSGPPPPAGTLNPSNAITPELVTTWYQRYLGRSPSPEEITGATGHPGGASALLDFIANSPEAKTYNTQWQQPQNPGTPPPTGGGGPAPTSMPTSTQFPPFGTPPPSPTNTPLPTAPTFTPPGYTAPPAFSFKDFTAPTAAEALNDPGYQFRVTQGRDVLEHGAAARGILNTGMTLKGILDYGQNAASQEYQNVYTRDAGTYAMNRRNALDAYNTNYQTQYADPYRFAYQSASGAFQPTMDAWKTNAGFTERANEFGTNTAMRTWEDQYAQFLNAQRDQWGRAKDVLTA